MTPLNLIREGLLTKNFDLIHQGYIVLTGENLNINDIPLNKPETTKAPVNKKKTSTRKKSKPVDNEDDEDISLSVDNIVAGPLPNSKSGKVKSSKMVFITQTEVDPEVVAINKNLAKQQKQSKQPRPKSKTVLPCPRCSSDVFLYKNAKKFIIDQNSKSSVNLQCPACNHSFEK